MGPTIQENFFVETRDSLLDLSHLSKEKKKIQVMLPIQKLLDLIRLFTIFFNPAMVFASTLDGHRQVCCLKSWILER